MTGRRAIVTDLVGQLMTGAAAAAAAGGGGGGGGGGGRVRWDKSSVVAHQGDNVTLACTARSVDFIDVLRLTLTPDSDAAAAPATARRRWTIADNDAVKSPFTALPRYAVAMSVDRRRRAVVQLQLTGQCTPLPAHTLLRFIISTMTLTNRCPGISASRKLASEHARCGNNADDIYLIVIQQ